MKTVITYGTFDLFHKGHYNILKRAKELGDYLIVGVTSENFDIDRGKLNVKDSLMKRIENVRNSGFADKIIVEEYQGQKLRDIKKYKVDIFAIGSDWIGKFDYIQEYCKIVYLERTKNISSTQLRNEGKIYKIGIATNREDDNETIVESKLVSGLSCEGVFHPDKKKAKAFGQKHQLDYWTDDFDTLLDKSDILFFQMEPGSGGDFKDYLMRAIEMKKYVIYDGYSLEDPKDIIALHKRAKEKKCPVFDNISIAYNRQFDQLLWYLKGNIVGNLCSLNINVDSNVFENGEQNTDKILYLSLYVATKIFDGRIKKLSKFISKDGNYYSVYFVTDEGEVKINIGAGYEIESGLEVIGETGRLFIPDDWWNLRYYRIKHYNKEFMQRYSFNHDGNGKRYLFMEVISVIESGKYPKYKVLEEDSVKIMKLIKKLKDM